MVLAFSSMLLVVMALLLHATIAATRADHLMVLYWGGSELFLFVRRASGRRYDRIHLWQVPRAVVAYAWGRVLARVHPPKPVLAPVPVRTREARFARLAH